MSKTTFYIYFIPAIILLYSCTKHDDAFDTNIPIIFSSYLGNDKTPSNIKKTRGVITPKTDLNGKEVAIFGTASSKIQHDWDESEKIIQDYSGMLQGAPNSYNINYDTRYFLKDPSFYYSFRVVYPVSPQDGITITTNPTDSKPIIELDITKQPDLMIASADGVQKSRDAIQMEFCHLLTQVIFTIKKDGSVTNQVYLDQVMAAGYSKATIAYPKITLEKTNYSDRQDFILFNPGIDLFQITTTEQEIPGFLLLPQTATDTYEFKISLNNNSRTSTFELPINETWQPGKSYLYHLRILPEKVEISLGAIIEGWVPSGEC